MSFESFLTEAQHFFLLVARIGHATLNSESLSSFPEMLMAAGLTEHTSVFVSKE